MKYLILITILLSTNALSGVVDIKYSSEHTLTVPDCNLNSFFVSDTLYDSYGKPISEYHLDCDGVILLLPVFNESSPSTIYLNNATLWCPIEYLEFIGGELYLKLDCTNRENLNSLFRNGFNY